jgi:hypothetical protein
MPAGHRRSSFPEHLKSFFNAGPDFDLSLELGTAGNDQHAAAAISRLWSYPQIEGPWITRLVPNGSEGEFGILRIAGVSASLPFAAYRIREQHSARDKSGSKIQFGVSTEEPSDWLTLGIPVRALRAQWSVDDTWCVATQPWLLMLCDGLARVADHIHTHAPIAVGVMGEETSGCWRRPTPTRAREAHQDYPPLALLNAEVIEQRGAVVLPPDLWAELAPDAPPFILDAGLHYVPPQPNAHLTGA